MVVGAGSESYRTLRYLVGRLPVMITPSWLRTPTQPIGIDAAVEYLRRAPEVPESSGREVQIGGPDVLSFSEMMDRMAIAMGKRPPRRVPVPFITPWLSSLWLGLVTPGRRRRRPAARRGPDHADRRHRPERRRALRRLAERFDEALRRALAEDERGTLGWPPAAGSTAPMRRAVERANSWSRTKQRCRPRLAGREGD